jgi:hypothetical protein
MIRPADTSCHYRKACGLRQFGDVWWKSGENSNGVGREFELCPLFLASDTDY